ncbi:NosD domain-containing protein [Chloroflexota bacterium]
MKRLFALAVPLFIAVALLVQGLPCQTYAEEGGIISVDDDGQADFATIQEAVDAAYPGQQILVRRGTYHENLVIDKELWIQGEGMPTIDGSGEGSTIIIQSQFSVAMEGFEVTGSGSVPGDAAINIVSSGLLMSDCIVFGCARGIITTSAGWSEIAFSNFSNNDVAIELSGSSGNKLIVNTISDCQTGISLHNSNANRIIESTIDATDYGIRLVDSHNNRLIDNTVSVASTGISLETGDGNTIGHNTATLNEVGMAISGSNNVIYNSTISQNTTQGVSLSPLGEGNELYLNTLVDNGQNAVDPGGGNSWDNGEKGNFWSDYAGEDADGDGIGDTPYEIPGDSARDNYPLMEPPEVLIPDIWVHTFPLSHRLNPDSTGMRVGGGFRVHNSGPGDLLWNLVEQPVVVWLRVYPFTSGTVEWGYFEPLYLIFDSTGMEPGGYSTTLHITSNDPDNGAIDVPVTLNVGLVSPVAETSLSLEQLEDGAVGAAININRVKDAVTDRTVDFVPGGYNARFFYEPSGLEIKKVRCNASFGCGTVNIQNAKGWAAFAAVAPSNSSPLPVNVAWALVSLVGPVTRGYELTLGFCDICDMDGELVAAESFVTMTFQRGDVNGDGSITIGDALLAEQYLAGIRQADSINLVNMASICHDDDFDIVAVSDVLFLKQYLAGMRDASMNPT